MAHIANYAVAGLLPSPVPSLPSSRSTATRGTSAERSFVFRMQHQESQQPFKYGLFPREQRLPAVHSGKALNPERAFAFATAPRVKKPATHSNAAVASRFGPNSLSQKRKISVPELVSALPTDTIAPMDSPTIPGRPPIHERSMSAPGHASQQIVLGNSFLNTDEEDDDDDDDGIATPVPQRSPPATSKSTPPQLWKALPPLKIPPGSPPPLGPRAPASAPIKGSGMQTYTPVMSARTDRASSPEENDDRRAATALGHRHWRSEASIMDRGRPRRRADFRPNVRRIAGKNSPIRETSAERRAFEDLPKGCNPSDAFSNFSAQDIAVLQKQACAQAQRFEILRPEEVEALSRELRNLDERTEYLRQTYMSLRAGRRNLQSRICQYTRSCQAAGLNYPVMLEQEEALAELDASIDDWVVKLEKAENRSIRVRQKLLEHVAAAAILPSLSKQAPITTDTTPLLSPQAGKKQGPTMRDPSTPPRSPTRQPPSSSGRTVAASPSPERVVARVPSTIIERRSLEAAAAHEGAGPANGRTSLKRADLESIRIYAGDGLYSLLTSVDNRLSEISNNVGELPLPESPVVPRNGAHFVKLQAFQIPLSPTQNPKPVRQPESAHALLSPKQVNKVDLPENT